MQVRLGADERHVIQLERNCVYEIGERRVDRTGELSVRGRAICAGGGVQRGEEGCRRGVRRAAATERGAEVMLASKGWRGRWEGRRRRRGCREKREARGSRSPGEPCGAEKGKKEAAKYVAVPAGLLLAVYGLRDEALATVQREEMGTALVFALGYSAIVFEEQLGISKAAVALCTSVLMWAIRAAGNSQYVLSRDLNESVGNVSQIVFFLLGAMSIVETIELHSGFQIITSRIRASSRKTLLWILSAITFFLSSVCDNLSALLVMVSLLRKLIPDDEERRYFGAVLVLAANAGGAFTVRLFFSLPSVSPPISLISLAPTPPLQPIGDGAH